MTIQKHPIKSKFCKLRLLCRSLAGNNVYCLTVTAPVADDDSTKVKYFTYFCFGMNFIHFSLPPARIPLYSSHRVRFFVMLFPVVRAVALADIPLFFYCVQRKFNFEILSLLFIQTQARARCYILH